MGEYAAKFQPGIDLDEFERRLRAAAPAPRPAQAEKPDPLAELARLVGGEGLAKREDPFEALFRAQSAISDLRREQGVAHEPLHAPHEPYFSESTMYRPQSAPDAASGEEPRFADEAYHGSEHDWSQDSGQAGFGADDGSRWAGQNEQAAQAPAAPVRRRGAVFGIAALLLAGVAAIGGTLAMRARSGPRGVVTIQADSDPARIKPEQADNSSGANSQTLFDRKDDGNVAKVVSKAEQPADLSETVKAARVVGPAANVPAPPVPLAAAPSPAPQGDAIFPAPKKVKTVAVRADGSLVDGSSPNPQAARGLPSLASMPAPTGGTITPAAPSSSASAPAIPAPPVPAPSRPAAPKIAERAAAPARPAPAKPAAHAEAEPEIGGETGVYAVQLAGSPVESEARAAATRLGAKYASALKGRQPTFIEAKVGDKTVYRVRVGHLTQAAAQSMCSAIKGQGGQCFVAK